MRIPIETFRLENGLLVSLSEDHTAPLVAVNLWYHVGSANERVGRTGFAHLFEHMLFQGSAHVEANEHFELVQRAGGTLNGSTWLDRTNYFETLPSQYLALGLWLESDRMGFLLNAVTQEKFEIQRDTVKNERGQNVENAPYGRFNEVLSGILTVRSFAMEDVEKNRFLSDVSKANRVVSRGVGTARDFRLCDAPMKKSGAGRSHHTTAMKIRSVFLAVLHPRAAGRTVGAEFARLEVHRLQDPALGIEDDRPRALIGVRSCDLHAIAVQDRVLMEGAHVDRDYAARRRNTFIVAVNCGQAAATCFCVSMNTGPRSTAGSVTAGHSSTGRRTYRFGGGGLGAERGTGMAPATGWTGSA